MLGCTSVDTVGWNSAGLCLHRTSHLRNSECFLNIGSCVLSASLGSEWAYCSHLTNRVIGKGRAWASFSSASDLHDHIKRFVKSFSFWMLHFYCVNDRSLVGFKNFFLFGIRLSQSCHTEASISIFYYNMCVRVCEPVYLCLHVCGGQRVMLGVML